MPIIINNKKSKNLKIFLILKDIEVKFSIRLNKETMLKVKNDIILLNLIIFWKLLKIFILIILISWNFIK